jgi:two-component system, OmpR family, aerobic respiration control sensor histidine kinase ArcB
MADQSSSRRKVNPSTVLRARKPPAQAEPRMPPGDAPVEYDPDCLANLLRIVGPTRSDELLNQLHQDFDRSRTALGIAIEHLVWADLRRVSHNLIALAGTVGAKPLYAAAQRLHQDSKAEDVRSLAAVSRDILQLMTRLIAQLETRRREQAQEGNAR